MNESSPLPPPSRPDIDGQLREFFRSEMPHPWPGLDLPESTRPQVVPSWWQRSRLRLGLAASVALALASYLALAGVFPRVTPSSALELNGPNIAGRPTHHKARSVRPHAETPPNPR